MTATELTLFIDGEWQSASTADFTELRNPSTGDLIAKIPSASASDLDTAAIAAQKGFDTWRRMPPAQRSAIISKAASLLIERVEQIAVIMSSEQGKPIAEARAETIRAAELIEWSAEESRRTYGLTIPAPEAHRYLTFWEPIGPVLAITPWNFPLVAPARKIGTSLAAGCSCIIKPSEVTPLSTIELVKAFHDAGLPAGVLNLVLGRSSFISDRLLNSDIIKAVTFTGSVAVGKALGSKAGGLLKPALLELGGHSPVIVFDDVDVEKIARAAVTAKFRNSGQVCTSPTRFYVQDAIYERFVDEFASQAAMLRLDPDIDGPNVMGPVVNERRRAAVLELIEDASKAGARVLTGGRAKLGKGSFMEPTVIADVPETARIMNEEPFGPVAVFNRFSTMGEVIEKANRLPFALASYLFTKNIGNAHAVAHGLECGIVGVNSFSGSNPETPFGGNKDSGYGREGGTEGVREYMTLKLIVEGNL